LTRLLGVLATLSFGIAVGLAAFATILGLVATPSIGPAASLVRTWLTRAAGIISLALGGSTGGCTRSKCSWDMDSFCDAPHGRFNVSRLSMEVRMVVGMRCSGIGCKKRGYE